MIQTLFCPDASSKAIFIIPDRDFGYKTVNPFGMNILGLSYGLQVYASPPPKTNGR